jgi:hypothetical protein
MFTTSTATDSLTTLLKRELIPSVNRCRRSMGSLEVAMSQMKKDAPLSETSQKSLTPY